MLDWRKETEDMLAADTDVGALTVFTDDEGKTKHRIYKVTAQKDEGFPRIVIRELENNPSYWSDGEMWDAVVRVEIWVWAKTYDEWIATLTAVNKAMKGAKWTRVSVGADDFVPGIKVFEKSIRFARSKMKRI